MKNNTIKYWIWLSRLKNIKCTQKEILLNKFKSPERIWNLDKKTLLEVERLNAKCINEILNQEYREDLEKYEKYIIDNNIKIITIFDEQYPKKLKNIYDKPIILYAKGNLELLKQDGIAIVGCRNCSEYGKQVSKNFAMDLAKQNKCIISGLAKGIDTFAHIGALEAGGNTIAVIGNGLDNIYPYENKNLCERILKNNGLIITEYLVGTKPDKLNFPERNRIISALADGILVVEAQEKSGALITADFGLEHGKDIFAIPGNITSINSKGTNKLIQQGANLVINSNDIIEFCYGIS